MAKKGLNMVMIRDNFNLVKKIPLHYQKRYLANISNGSFNATLMTGIYKNKIKTLLKNNRTLALALQNDKTKKEELLNENKSNASIIMFSRLKLTSLSDSLKNIVSIVDETLALLQMHSSVSSSKFTPKNTQGREEFKEQVKGVLMDSIPEDEEFESPQKVSNQTKKGVAVSNKKLSHHLNEEISPEIQKGISDKTHQLTELENSEKTLKPSKSNKKPFMEKTNKIYKDTISHGTNYEYCQPITSVNNFEESSPAKIAATKSKKLLNKNFRSEVCCKKASPNSTASKKGDKAAKNVVWENVKRVRSFNKDINNKENSSSLKNDMYRNRLRNDVKILDIQQRESNSSTKNENKNLDVACTLKNSVHPIKLLRDNVNDTYVVSDREEKNKSSDKKRKTTAKKFESLEEDDLASAVTKKRGRSSALKSLSSKINIENSKESGKGKTCQIDDLITTKQKSAGLMLTTDSSKSYDDSRSYLQDLSLQQQEMIRNLAENTFLVTAEVHKSSELLETNKMKFPKTECFRQNQPIVLVKDIFQPGKSFCKSISSQLGDELNRIPLELQLLEHCSSLKVIPEESTHTQDNSIDQTEDKAQKTKVKNVEPPLSVEGEVVEQLLCEDKRAFRKRSGSVNYREPPLNIKQRR